MSKNHAEQEKNILASFKKKTFFGYFDTFEEIQRFLKVLVICFFLLMITASIGCVYLYQDVNKKTLAIVTNTNAVSTYLHQQQLLNLKSFAIRLATEYANISYYNTDLFLDRLEPFVLPMKRNALMTETKEWMHIVTAGRLIRQFRSVDYTMAHAVNHDPQDGRQSFKVTIPIRITVARDGFPSREVIDTTFVAILSVSEKTLSNPYGLYIQNFGNMNDQKVRTETIK